MRKLKSFIGLVALLALPALGSAPASAADLCPPGTTTPAYCPYAQTPTVETGPTTAISRTTAVVTGSINPHGASVYWAFQYGRTASYGALTTITFLAPTTSTVRVSFKISGLTPGTTFHYRLIAINRAQQIGVGRDRTFTTLKSGGSGDVKLKTTLTLRGAPRRDRTLPFTYTFSGRVKIPAGTRKSKVCGGTVSLKLKKSGTTVATGRATVSKKCTYRKTITITSTSKTGTTPGTLEVSARYGGNSKLKVSKKTTTVRFF